MADAILYLGGRKIGLFLQGDGTYAINSTATIVTGDIEIGAVEIKDADTDNRGNVKAANTARTTATIVHAVQHVDAAGNPAILPAALAAGGGLKVEGVAGGVPAPVVPTPTLKVPVQITKTVAAIAVPEALAADATYFQKATIIAKKAARTANTGTVFLGIGATDDTQPRELVAGAVIEIIAPEGQKYDLNDFYLDVATAGDGVVIIYS